MVDLNNSSGYNEHKYTDPVSGSWHGEDLYYSPRNGSALWGFVVSKLAS
jgi:hypothetical protein